MESKQQQREKVEHDEIVRIMTQNVMNNYKSSDGLKHLNITIHFDEEKLQALKNAK